MLLTHDRDTIAHGVHRLSVPLCDAENIDCFLFCQFISDITYPELSEQLKNGQDD